MQFDNVTTIVIREAGIQVDTAGDQGTDISCSAPFRGLHRQVYGIITAAGFDNAH